MNILSVVVWIASGIVVFVSFLMAVLQKPMWLNEKKYTYVSLVAFSRPAGILGMILGISGGLVLYYLSLGVVNSVSMIALAILCCSYVAYFVLKKKILVLKRTKTKKIKK